MMLTNALTLPVASPSETVCMVVAADTDVAAASTKAFSVNETCDTVNTREEKMI